MCFTEVSPSFCHEMQKRGGYKATFGISWRNKKVSGEKNLKNYFACFTLWNSMVQIYFVITFVFVAAEISHNWSLVHKHRHTHNGTFMI